MSSIMRCRKGLMGLSDIAKPPVSHGVVEPHDPETGLSPRVVLQLSPSSSPDRPPLPRERFSPMAHPVRTGTDQERVLRVDSGRLAADKVVRLHAQTAIENGFVFLPDEAAWLADYVSELTTFPAGRHDDQVDSTARALA